MVSAVAAAAAAKAASAAAPCARCVLRARNVRQPAAYAAASTGRGTAVCPVCLGVLQDETLSTITSTLQAHLAPIRHANQIKINATLPASISHVRDRAFRISLAARRYPCAVLAVDIGGPPPPPPVSLRESLKWTLSPLLSDRFDLCYHPDAELFLDVAFRHPTSGTDIAFAAACPPPSKKRRPSGNRAGLDTTMHVVRVTGAMSDDEFVRSVPHLIPPPPVAEPVSVDTGVSVASVYFAGMYNKLSRVVSQTPWHADGPDEDGDDGNAAPNRGNARDRQEGSTKGDDVKMEDVKTGDEGRTGGRDERDDAKRRKFVSLSVEDVVVAGLRDELRAEKLTFSAGGREDVDVRMLGSGRPFFVEAVNPRIVPSEVDADLLSRAAAGSVEASSAVRVRGLRQVDKGFAAGLRLVEADKRKHYRAVVWTESAVPLSKLRSALQVEGGFDLQQRTPLRVLHRRTQAVRPRSVFAVSVVRAVTPHVCVIDIEAQAGTYIKEFVHGDNGRTMPNVAHLLGCDADILQLDVTHISLQGGGLAAVAAAAAEVAGSEAAGGARGGHDDG